MSGRSQQLIQERNLKIAECYYQLESTGLRYDLIIQSLCKAFFLSEYRMMAIIREMVKAGTFVKGEPIKPVKRSRRSNYHPIQLKLQLELF